MSIIDGLKKPTNAVNSTLREPSSTDNGKTHGFPKDIANIRDAENNRLGVTSALLFRYIAFRNRRPTERRSGKAWTRACIEGIKKAYPYLSESAIDEGLRRLEKFKLCLISAFNRKKYDRTRWYHIPEELANKAEVDIIQFDSTAAKALGVSSAIILHNFRHWIKQCNEKGLKEIVKMSPRILAELLPMDKSTIKRALKTLQNAGIIYKLSDTKPCYGPGVHFLDSSYPGSVGSKPISLSSKADKVGSKADNDMYCKSINKDLEKSSKGKPAASLLKLPSSAEETDNETSLFTEGQNTPHLLQLEAQEESGQANTPEPNPISNQSHYTLESVYNVENMDALRSKTQSLNAEYFNTEMRKTHLLNQVEDVAYAFLQVYSEPDLEQISEITEQDELFEEIFPRFRDWFPKTIDTTTFLFEWIYFGTLESIIGGFAWLKMKQPESYQHGSIILQRTTADIKLSIYKVLDDIRLADIENEFAERTAKYQSIDLGSENEIDIPPAEKTRIFRNGLSSRNKIGWIFFDQTLRFNEIRICKAGLDLIDKIFEINPHLSPRDLLNVMDKCMYMYSNQPAPKEFRRNSFWHARMGHNVLLFAKYLKAITRQLEYAKNNYPYIPSAWVKIQWDSPTPEIKFLSDF